MSDALPESQFTIDPTGEKKVILSIDGGGMRGAIPIAMLAELETRSGKTCQEMFHMVAGTSTGAIIAVGLAVGMTANEILEKVYRESLGKGFVEREGSGNFFWRAASALLKAINQPLFVSLLVANALRYAYPLKPFLTELKPLVGTRTVGQLDSNTSKYPILFATTRDTLTRNTYFIVSAGPGKARFADWPLPAVVASSGAAPVFFPPVENRFIDGGVGVYTNPCLGASIEAAEYIAEYKSDNPEEQKYYKSFNKGNLIHISLGTGYIDNKRKPDEIERYWVRNWVEYVINENLNDGALQQVYATRAIYSNKGPVKEGQMDFRRYNPWLDMDTVKNKLGISEVKTDPTKLSLDSHHKEEVDLMFEIGRAYARNIDWSKPNQMPWDTDGGHPEPGTTHQPMTWTGTDYS